MFSVERKLIEAFIVKHGGSYTSAINSKTNYLLCGRVLEDGRKVEDGNKYKAAKQKGVSVLTEEMFRNMVSALSSPEVLLDL